MKKFTLPFIFALTFGFFLIQLMGAAQALPNIPAPFTTTSDIYLGPQSKDGIVSTSHQAIFGPLICVDHGDPFSPYNSPFTDNHPYSYRYRIMIPPDYSSDILRVELFDPDAINTTKNNDTVVRTQVAQSTGMTATIERSCSSNSPTQKWPCLIPTGEVDSTGTPVGGFSSNQVNFFWFLRVDENWGRNTGNCDADNSQYRIDTMPHTLFELYYFQDNQDGTTTTMPLASYTGQNGSEATNHYTDLHWVSPGADISFGSDKPTGAGEVPVNPGATTENGFEIDLTQEIPNIVTDPTTGIRYIYLDVTTLDGSSENGFEIWAGPPDYVNSVPSQVNQRNIYVLDNPGSHNSQGVQVFAMGYLPQNSNVTYPVERPLIDIPPTAAGESIYISLFDSDAGARPPVTFYLDTIPREDWSLTFGDTNTAYDPDGITTTLRCLPGFCNGSWVDPAYEIKLPSGSKDCDFTNPTPETCTPFYGGRLMATYHGGRLDTYGWQVSAPENDPDNPDQYNGCEAFPITIHEGVRSVTASAYPDPQDFGNPNPPSYESFIYHVSNVPLLNAKEGMVYKVQQGFGSGRFGWLVWNEGINPSSATLGNSLTWPGDTLDYTNHEDGGIILPGQTHVVRGYIEPGDPTDTDLHVGDWVATSTGSLNSTPIRAIVEEHIALGRVLRLPIWSEATNGGANGAFRASGFALFRIHGYHSSQVDSWILLEFIRWDRSCGQNYNITPLTNVTIDGATFTAPNESIIFEAAIAPLDATQPVTYTWSTTDHAPITHLDNLSDTIAFNWTMTGTKTITVTAENAGSIVTDTHTIIVTDLVNGEDLIVVGAPQLVTPLPLLANTPVEFEVTVRNLGYVDVNTAFFVDLFVNPTTLNPDGIPPAQSSGSIAVANLAGGENKIVNITLPAGLPLPNGSHAIYAMADTLNSIAETTETNNVSAASHIYDYQMIQPPEAMHIVGATFSLFNEDVTFTADVTPLTTTQPLSYTWEATDFAPITQSNDLTDTISFNWATTGNKTITVTAENAAGVVTATHTILISDLVQGQDLVIDGAPQLITPLPVEEGEPLEFAVTVKNLGDTAVSSQAFIDLFVNPSTMHPDGIPPEQSAGFSILFDLDPGASKTINVTLPDGLTKPNTAYQIYAMIDTFKSIDEVDESNNVSAPLAFDASNFAEKKYIYLPIIIKN